VNFYAHDNFFQEFFTQYSLLDTLVGESAANLLVFQPIFHLFSNNTSLLGEYPLYNISISDVTDYSHIKNLFH